VADDPGIRDDIERRSFDDDRMGAACIQRHLLGSRAPFPKHHAPTD